MKESPVEGPRTLVEPANGSRRQLTGDMDVQNLRIRLRRYFNLLALKLNLIITCRVVQYVHWCVTASWLKRGKQKS